MGAYVLIPLEEYKYEQRFHQSTLAAAKIFRQAFIDEKVAIYMKDPVQLIGDMRGSNELIRAVLDAVTEEQMVAAKDTLNDAILNFAIEVAEHDFAMRGYQ